MRRPGLPGPDAMGAFARLSPAVVAKEEGCAAQAGAACGCSPALAARLAGEAAALRERGEPGALLADFEALLPPTPVASTGPCRACDAALQRRRAARWGEALVGPEPAELPVADTQELPLARFVAARRLVQGVVAALHGELRERMAPSERPFALLRAQLVTPLLPAALEACDGAELPVLPSAARLLYALSRSCLGLRPLLARLPDGAPPAELALAALLSASPHGGDEALAAPIRALLAEEHAPSRPLADAAILYDPTAELLTGGRHGLAAAAALEAFAQQGWLTTAVTELRRAPVDALVVVAESEALPLRLVRHLLAHVERGGAAVVRGALAAVDEDGLPIASPGPALPEGGEGEVAWGRGRLFFVPEDDSDGVPALLRAGRALLPEGLRCARTSGLGRVAFAAERAGRRAVLRLADREPFPGRSPEGLVLHLGGPLSRARAAEFLAPGHPPEPVRVNRAARGTTLVLPPLPLFSLLRLTL